MQKFNSTEVSSDAKKRLGKLDKWLIENVPCYLSMQNLKVVPTSFCELANQHLFDSSKTDFHLHVVSGLEAIIAAIYKHFPENIFWDFDYLFCFFNSLPTIAVVDQTSELIVELQELFGLSSNIRFRYSHDFLYGFDWARWVRKDPENRSSVLPFDIEFLKYLKTRHQELLNLIATNDAKYGELNGANFRNPFAFNREPEAEKILHKALAHEGLVPCFSWQMDGGAKNWNLDYTQLRKDWSVKLQIPSTENTSH